MSKRHRRRLVAAAVVFALAAAAVGTAVFMARGEQNVAAPALEAEAIPPALAKRLAELSKATPSLPQKPTDVPWGWADQDLYERSVDGNGDGPPTFEHFATARNDWHGLLGRPASGTGKWVPYGPVNPHNDLKNLGRDRSWYNAGTENFGGRTVHGVISPACRPAPAECVMWIANANGGVWKTENALAEDNPATGAYEGPAWEFMSETFEMNNVSSLELDPNDTSYQTLWAGTGEPNACGSGCEIGVGVYVSKSGGEGWQGPLGEKHFFGRAVGTIEVKPGDSKTIFAGSGRAVRGVSNTCCGGADALTPGGPHFGTWRSLDAGKTWELVHMGAPDLCNQTATPDQVSMNQTACSPRGARRIRFDPVDPNTIYVSYFARGIWRSRANGNPGSWEQIMAPLGTNNAERAEFDVVAVGGKTRMYVGVGQGITGRFRRNDDVRDQPSATVQNTWIDLTSSVEDTPGYSSFGYCDPQCFYDQYVYAPATHAPLSGASPDVVYLSGSNQYAENDWGPASPFYARNPGSTTGRSNGRALLLSTNGGTSFYDMTEDASHPTHPGALHPDHHALVVNPLNWRQFFDLGDGGVNRSNGVFVNASAQCDQPKGYLGTRNTFCKTVLAQVPERLDAINVGLRTLHFYQLEYDRRNPERIAGGTQDNGSWETVGDRVNWLNVNIADGGHNGFDAPTGDPDFAMTAFQNGMHMVRYRPQDQSDVNWVSDTLFRFSLIETAPFIANSLTDPVQPGWLWTGREHVFRSTNYGRNPVFQTKEQHRAVCNIWSGTFIQNPCDDWKPLGDAGPDGRLTSPVYGDRSGGHVAHLERAPTDVNTLWAATSTGRIFVSKNANDPNPASVEFDRIDDDPTAANDPPRYPTSIFVDRKDPNHAWITYSGYNSKTPATPGHVFEVRYVPNASTFVILDGHKTNGYGDIPAQAIIVTPRGTLYVANDYNVVVKEPNSDVWKMAAAGLPNMLVADLVHVPEKDVLYAATHGQGVWQLQVQ